VNQPQPTQRPTHQGLLRAALLRNALIVDPQGAYHDQRVDLRYGNNQILDIAPPYSLAPTDNEPVIVDAYVSVGWVAMLCELNEPGHETRDTLRHLAASAVAGGFSDVVVSPTSKPCIDEGPTLESAIAKAQNMDIQVHFCGSLTKGLKGEALAGMAELAAVGAVAFSDGPMPLVKDEVLLRCFEYACNLGKPVLHVPMEAGLAHACQVNESPQTVGLGLKPFPELAEDLAVAKAIRMAEYAQAIHLHLSPITTTRSLKLVLDARQKGLHVTAGVSPYHLYFSDADLDSFDSWLKFYPPLRSENNRIALIANILEDSALTIDMHHAPRTQEEKELEFDYAAFGAPVLETAFGLYNRLIANREQTAPTWVNAVAKRPRQLLGLANSSVEKGAEISLTVFELNSSWAVSKHYLKTLYKGSPVLGHQLSGSAIAVLC